MSIILSILCCKPIIPELHCQVELLPQSLDRIWRDLSCSLHLLIGLGCFISLLVDHSVWFAAKGGMRALVAVERDPLSDARFRF